MRLRQPIGSRTAKGMTRGRSDVDRLLGGSGFNPAGAKVTYRPSVPMPSQPLTAADAAALPAITFDDKTILAIADFSPGLWWGANGVQRLVVTEDHLHVVQVGRALTTGQLAFTASLRDVSSLKYWLRRGLGGQVVRLTLEASGAKRSYTSKYRQGVELCKILAERVPGSSA